MRTRTKIGCAIASTLSLMACDALDPTSFDRIRDTSEIIVARGPGGGNGATGFGSVLVGFGTRVPDSVMTTRSLRASRFITSGGAGSAYSVFAVFDEQVIDQRSTTGLRVTAGPDPRYSGCIDASLCGVGSSVSFATAAIWHRDAMVTGAGCVIVPSGNVLVDQRSGARREQIQIRCEPSSNAVEPLDMPVQGVELGASATSLPVEHPLGAAIFGAPGDAMGDGGLYRIDDYPVSGFIHVDLTRTPVGAGIGRTLASVALADGTILLATGGRGRPDDPVVVVATIDPSGTTVLRACLRGRGTQFGSALTFGNFDDDTIPDLVVGAGVWASDLAGAQHVEQPIVIYSGTTLARGAALGCEDPPSTPLAPGVSIPCQDDVEAGYHCAASASDTYTGFGASLAAADVNGDMRDDLIIGAPLANVRAAGAGVLRVLAGGASFDALGQTDRSTLTYSTVAGGAHLGAAVAVVPGVDRFEIVAGAPGAGRVALFFCAGIRGDRPQDFAGMTGVTHGCVIAPHTEQDVDAAAPIFDSGAAFDSGAGEAGVDAASDGGSDAGTRDADIDAADQDADLDASVDAG